MRLRGITQHQLAELSGISQPSISFILNNKRSPRWETMCKLADALGVTLEHFRRDLEDFGTCAETGPACLHA